MRNKLFMALFLFTTLVMSSPAFAANYCQQLARSEVNIWHDDIDYCISQGSTYAACRASDWSQEEVNSIGDDYAHCTNFAENNSSFSIPVLDSYLRTLSCWGYNDPMTGPVYYCTITPEAKLEQPDVFHSRGTTVKAKLDTPLPHSEFFPDTSIRSPLLAT